VKSAQLRNPCCWKGAVTCRSTKSPTAFTHSISWSSSFFAHVRSVNVKPRSGAKSVRSMSRCLSVQNAAPWLSSQYWVRTSVPTKFAEER